MEQQPRPYRGFLITCIVLIGIPLLFVFLIHLWINVGKPFPTLQNQSFAVGVGFGLGTVFHLSCIVAGAFTEPFLLLKRRVADFFENLTVSPSLAFRCYAQDIRDDGVTFTVYFLIMLTCFVLAANGIKATWF
jgi:hypothetical protein